MGDTLRRSACLTNKEPVLLMVEEGPGLPLSEAAWCFKARAVRNHPLLLPQGGGVDTAFRLVLLGITWCGRKSHEICF